MNDIILGLARHILTSGGGYLVAHGLATSGDAQMLIGAGLVLVGMVLSALNKKLKPAA